MLAAKQELRAGGRALQHDVDAFSGPPMAFALFRDAAALGGDSFTHPNSQQSQAGIVSEHNG